MILALALLASMADSGDSIAINSPCRVIRLAEGRANYAVFLSPDANTRITEGERLRRFIVSSDSSLVHECDFVSPWFEGRAPEPVADVRACLDAPKIAPDPEGVSLRPWVSGSPTPCSSYEIGLLARGGILDPLKISEIGERCDLCTEQDLSAISEWRSARAETESRADFLIRLLTSGNPLVRQWAFEDISSDFDPRNWNPADVAAAIRALEIADAAAAKAGMDVMIDHHERAWDIFRRLARVGQLRVLEITQLRYVHLADRESARGSMHFPRELNLYAEEWVQQNGGVLSWEISRKELLAYFSKRWRETDRAAPHPDMEAVKAVLEELRRAKKK